MIRIGPAGIPLSCKGRTLKDGIIYTKSLELDALEVQFVRGIRMSEEEAREVGEVAKEADIELHVHAPYYTNLAGDNTNLEMTADKVLRAAKLATIMGANTTVVHPGFYLETGPGPTLDAVVNSAQRILEEFGKHDVTCRLGVVTMGKKAVFGTIDEVIEACRRVDGGLIPVLDFGAIHARGNGSLQTKEDFQEIFDKLAPLKLDRYLIHFTGVAYEEGNEKHHIPIKKGDLRFEPLVEVILENDYPVTIISNSPILEHDAMYMQIVMDRVKEKREQRIQREAQLARQEEERKKLEEERRKEAEKRQREKEREEAKKRKEAEREARRKAAEEKRRRREKERAERAKLKARQKKNPPKKKVVAKRAKVAKPAKPKGRSKKTANRGARRTASRKTAKRAATRRATSRSSKRARGSPSKRPARKRTR